MNDIFKAVADPTRREILLTIAQKPENVNSIATKFNMTRPAVSKHIKILMDNNLLRMEIDAEDGRQKNCYAQLEALNEITEYVKLLESFWENKLDSLGDYLSKRRKGAT